MRSMRMRGLRPCGRLLQSARAVASRGGSAVETQDLRQAVREHNIYRWAGLLLSELERIPEGSANHVSAGVSSVP